MAINLVSPHAPNQAWFLGAPVSRLIVVGTAILYVMAEMGRWHSDLVLDMDKILNDGQIYRIFVCNLTFSTMGELIMGGLVMAPLLRRFEREMGPQKFGTYLFFANAISIFWELALSQILLSSPHRYSGPYPTIGALMLLYHLHTPRLHPRFFGILGLDFSEKSITYFFALQVICSGASATLIPALCGALAGFLMSTPALPLNKWELPDALFLWMDLDPPQIVAARRPRGRPGRQQLVPGVGQGMGGMGGGGGGFGGGMMGQPGQPAAAMAPPPPPPPSEEAISQLVNMGFDREAVIRALGQSDNNVEAAANRLLSG